MGNEWWGYLHQNGKIHVKRFFSDIDMQDAAESPFVLAYCGPFEAFGRVEAERIATEQLGVHA